MSVSFGVFTVQTCPPKQAQPLELCEIPMTFFLLDQMRHGDFTHKVMLI